jgi:uncharacterized protein YgiM (DUF1202 family)
MLTSDPLTAEGHLRRHLPQEEVHMSRFLVIALLASTLSAGTAAAGPSHADQHGGMDYRGAGLLSNPTLAVTARSAEVHLKPNTLSQILTTLAKGTKVAVKEMTATGWAHVDVNGTDGYIIGAKLQ